ncbi:hypothetical protein L7F22_064119 [Adiantum nelumboides]|nr:hypothetical protein [Adiantum nelumboides]
MNAYLVFLLSFVCAALSLSPNALCNGSTTAGSYRGGDDGEKRDTTRTLLGSSLYDKHIGYRALRADNTPCPPHAAGRSYYSPDCFLTSGPVNPYSRGCSRITQCARDLS